MLAPPAVGFGKPPSCGWAARGGPPTPVTVGENHPMSANSSTVPGAIVRGDAHRRDRDARIGAAHAYRRASRHAARTPHADGARALSVLHHGDERAAAAALPLTQVEARLPTGARAHGHELTHGPKRPRPGAKRSARAPRRSRAARPGRRGPG